MTDASRTEDFSSSPRLQRLADFLALDPRNATLLRDYAREALQAGRFEAVLSAVQRLRLLSEERAADRRLLIAALRFIGRPEEAGAALEEALACWPGDVGLALDRSQALCAAGELERALQALPEQEGAGPLAGAVCAWRVRLLHHLGRLEQACAAARDFTVRQGIDDEVEASLLAVLVDRSLLDEAVPRAAALVERCEAAGAAFPYAAAEPLALAALHQGQTETARSWADRALAQRDDDGRIWLIRGLAHLIEGELTDAGSAVERAVAAMPAHAGSRLTLGWVRLLRGQRPAARQAFEDALAASPALADAQGSLAVVEALDGRTEAARAAIRRAEGLEPDNAAARLATALLEGRCDEAEVVRLARAVLLRSRRTDRAPAEAARAREENA